MSDSPFNLSMSMEDGASYEEKLQTQKFIKIITTFASRVDVSICKAQITIDLLLAQNNLPLSEKEVSEDGVSKIKSVMAVVRRTATLQKDVERLGQILVQRGAPTTFVAGQQRLGNSPSVSPSSSFSEPSPSLSPSPPSSFSSTASESINRGHYEEPAKTAPVKESTKEPSTSVKDMAKELGKDSSNRQNGEDPKIAAKAAASNPRSPPSQPAPSTGKVSASLLAKSLSTPAINTSNVPAPPSTSAPSPTSPGSATPFSNPILAPPPPSTPTSPLAKSIGAKTAPPPPKVYTTNSTSPNSSFSGGSDSHPTPPPPFNYSNPPAKVPFKKPPPPGRVPVHQSSPALTSAEVPYRPDRIGAPQETPARAIPISPRTASPSTHSPSSPHFASTPPPPSTSAKVALSKSAPLKKPPAIIPPSSSPPIHLNGTSPTSPGLPQRPLRGPSNPANTSPQLSRSNTQPSPPNSGSVPPPRPPPPVPKLEEASQSDSPTLPPLRSSNEFSPTFANSFDTQFSTTGETASSSFSASSSSTSAPTSDTDPSAFYEAYYPTLTSSDAFTTDDSGPTFSSVYTHDNPHEVLEPPTTSHLADLDDLDIEDDDDDSFMEEEKEKAKKAKEKENNKFDTIKFKKDINALLDEIDKEESSKKMNNSGIKDILSPFFSKRPKNKNELETKLKDKGIVPVDDSKKKKH